MPKEHIYINTDIWKLSSSWSLISEGYLSLVCSRKSEKRNTRVIESEQCCAEGTVTESSNGAYNDLYQCELTLWFLF